MQTSSCIGIIAFKNPQLNSSCNNDKKFIPSTIKASLNSLVSQYCKNIRYGLKLNAAFNKSPTLTNLCSITRLLRLLIGSNISHNLRPLEPGSPYGSNHKNQPILKPLDNNFSGND